MINRRNLIFSVAAAVAVPLMPVPPAWAGEETANPNRGETRLDKLVRLIDPTVDLTNPHTNETIKTRFYRSTGYDMDAVRQINWFMRDWRQNEAIQFDLRVLWALAAIRSAGMKDGHSGLISINSGYRTQATNKLLQSKGYRAARNSMHLRARAVDLVMPGTKVKDIVDYATWLQVGGVGHYPGRFTHIDSGAERVWTTS